MRQSSHAPDSSGAVGSDAVTIEAQRSHRVLVVDDDEQVRRTIARVLERHGWNVVASPHGHDAVAQLAHSEFEVLVSDVQMPDMSGIDLLRQVRSHDLELPVILITGAPTVATAAQAVDYGAVKYLPKPIEPATLAATVQRAAKLHHLARSKNKAMRLAGIETAAAGDRAGAEVQFERALESLWMAYQPILAAPEGTIYAYEALMRSEEPALPHPGAVLDAAERLQQVQRLGRVIRERAIAPLAAANADTLLFLNLHPTELEDPWLLDGQAPIAEHARQVVLEITERASLDSIGDLSRRVARLREIGYRIAVDDLGAGYAGLSSFARLEPEFVKIDMSLVRDVNTSKTRQKVIRSIASLCADLGMLVVAEGVETAAERDALVDLGCMLLQGYHFARPGLPFPTARW